MPKDAFACYHLDSPSVTRQALRTSIKASRYNGRPVIAYSSPFGMPLTNVLGNEHSAPLINRQLSVVRNRFLLVSVIAFR